MDNIWTYAGLAPPKSEFVPYVLSIRMPRGPVDILEHPGARQALEEHLALPAEEEPPTMVEEVSNDLVARLKEARISFVRTWFPWNFFEKSKDEEISFPLDTFVRALISNGIEIVGVVGNGYSRFLPRDVSVEHLGRYIERLVPASMEIVRHYNQSISVWQIENEPNWWREHVAADWRSGLVWLEPNSDLAILGALHDVIRRECPKGEIMVNVEGDRQSVDYERYSKYCDIVGLDLYPGYAHPHKTSAEELNKAELVKKETGKRVIIAETGYPSGPGILGYSEKSQAEYLKSASETAYSLDAISGLCAWRFSDSYWRSFPMQENHFGLLTKEGKPKPAWFAYSKQIEDLSGR